jgi:DNA primase
MTLIKLLNIPSNTLDQILEPFQTKSKILSRLNEKEKLNKDKIELPDFPLSKAEKNYLLDRHFNPGDLIKKYHIQGGGYVGDWKNRIIIPIYLGGKLISWTGRTIIKGREPRYKNLENHLSVINPKKIFFNLDNCHNDYVIVTEGPFDVIRFGDNSICGFGISLTRAQILFLAERFRAVYFLFDCERQAQKKAKEYAMLLQGYGVNAFIVDISDFRAKDLGELPPFKVRQLKRELAI